MKKKILFCIFITGCLKLFPVEVKLDFLVKKEWHETNNLIGFANSLTFDKNYKYYISSPMGEGAEGKFIIKDNKLIFYYENNDIVYELKENYHSIDFKYSLYRLTKIKNNTFESELFPKYYSEGFLQEGEIVDFDSFKVAKIKSINALTTDNLNFREFPTLSSRKFNIIEQNVVSDGLSEMNPIDEEKIANFYSYIPKGRKIIIHAKSIEKFRIGEWNNYWYLISIELKDNEYICIGKIPVWNGGFKYWIYGEFIKY